MPGKKRTRPEAFKNKGFPGACFFVYPGFILALPWPAAAGAAAGGDQLTDPCGENEPG